VRFDATGVVHPAIPDSPMRWINDTMPDSILNLTDPAAKAQAIQERWDSIPGPEQRLIERKYPSLGHDLPNALDSKNPFRGTGFSGSGANFSPEGTFGGTKVPVPIGAELWQTLPNGQREFLAVYQQLQAGGPKSWVLADSGASQGPMSGIGLRPTAGIGTALKENG
jgi:hypothetical protein